MSKSFGEILIGTTFNPSGQDDVQYVKNEFAKFINMAEDAVNLKLEDLYKNEEDEDKMIAVDGAITSLYTMAINNLVTPQMSLVKLLTFKNQ